MPFVNPEDVRSFPYPAIDDSATLDQEKLDGPDFMDEVLPAAFGLDNTLISTANLFMTDRDVNGDSKVVSNDEFISEIEGYEDYAVSFVDAVTKADFASVKSRIDKEIANRQVIAESGGLGFAATAAAVILDPINLIPGGVIMKGVKGGQKALKLGAASAVSGGLSATASEGVLQATQETRTAEESAAAIAASAILSGIIGGGLGFALESYGSRSLAEIERNIQEDLRDVYKNDSGSAVGANPSETTTIKQETLRGALGLEKLLSFQDPMLRSTRLSSVEARRTMQHLAEFPLEFKKNEEGIPSPVAVETLVKQWNANLYKGLVKIDELFFKYRKGDSVRNDFTETSITATDLFTPKSKRQKLTKRDFYAQVSRAMRRGDKHRIKEVREAAQTLRREVFDPLKNRAIDAGLFPEDIDVKTADSYLTRVYNTNKIAAKRPKFESKVTNWLKAARDNVKNDLEAGKFKGKKAKEIKDAEKFAELEDVEIEGITQEITDKILGSMGGRMIYTPFKLRRGPIKERTLGIPDVEIEEFLEDNIETISRVYTRTMAPDVELTMRFGDTEMKSAHDKILDEYAIIRKKAKTQRQLTELDKEKTLALNDLTAVRDRVRGTYKMPDDANSMAFYRVTRSAKNFNFIGKLGGMTVSALVDLGRPIMVHGIKKVLGSGVMPFVSNAKVAKLAAEEVKLAGTALDMVLDTRAMQMADMFDDYSRMNKFEAGLQVLSQKFSRLSLMAQWNSGMKQFAGIITQTRTMKAVEQLASGGKIKQAEKTRLASLGIDESMAARIASQFKKNGKKEKGVYWANTGDWEDFESAQVYRAALVKEVDKIIVSIGQDKPLWMSSALGSMIGQFKSFAFASTQRVLLAGLQQRDMAALNGLVAMVGLGMLVTKIKMGLAGKEAKGDIDWWLKEGFDRSGVAAWFFEVNNIAEKLTRGSIGLSALTGGEVMSRYQSRNAFGALLGPTFGTATDIVTITGAAATGEISESDVSAARRLVPYQNLFYTRWLFNEAEKNVYEAIGNK